MVFIECPIRLLTVIAASCLVNLSLILCLTWNITGAVLENLVPTGVTASRSNSREEWRAVPVSEDKSDVILMKLFDRRGR